MVTLSSVEENFLFGGERSDGGKSKREYLKIRIAGEAVAAGGLLILWSAVRIFGATVINARITAVVMAVCPWIIPLAVVMLCGHGIWWVLITPRGGKNGVEAVPGDGVEASGE
jgi:hypothetical protein